MEQAPGGGSAAEGDGGDPAAGSRAAVAVENAGSANGGPGGADARRRRYGRRRGTPPPGEWFVSRLGPAHHEPFATIDDPAVAPAPQRPAPDTPLDELRFVAVDCETTGQTPHRLVEVGAVAFTIRGHVASFETLVHCTDRINPYARRLHGITSELLAGAPRAEPVIARFREFAAGTVLVEHSADAFDTRLLGRTAGSPLDSDNVDTSRMAGLLWGLRDTIGLERLCGELGIAHRGPHTALGDAEGTAAAFLELLARCRTLFGWETLADLLAGAQPPPPRAPGLLADRRRARPAAPVTAESPSEAPDVDPDDGQRRRRRRGGRRRRRSPGDAPEAVPTGE